MAETESKIMTKEELEARGLNLESYPVVPEAHKMLKSQKLAFNRELREQLISRARELERQLSFAETEELVKEFQTSQQERWQALLKEEPDEAAQEAAQEVGEWRCGFPDCGEAFRPTIYNLVRKGRVVTHLRGQLEGLPIRVGSFLVKGEEIIPLCPKHQRRVLAAGGRLLPYEKASSAIQRKRERRREEEAAFDLVASTFQNRHHRRRKLKGGLD